MSPATAIPGFPFPRVPASRTDTNDDAQAGSAGSALSREFPYTSDALQVPNRATTSTSSRSATSADITQQEVAILDKWMNDAANASGPRDTPLGQQQIPATANDEPGSIENTGILGRYVQGGDSRPPERLQELANAHLQSGVIDRDTRGLLVAGDVFNSPGSGEPSGSKIVDPGMAPISTFNKIITGNRTPDLEEKNNSMAKWVPEMPASKKSGGQNHLPGQQDRSASSKSIQDNIVQHDGRESGTDSEHTTSTLDADSSNLPIHVQQKPDEDLTGYNIGHKSGNISVGSHRLAIQIEGPTRKPGEPIVILLKSIGSTDEDWLKVKQKVTPFARWMQYDRSGIGESEKHRLIPHEISSLTTAVELSAMLNNSGIEPPFIFVAHGMGGVVVRQWLSFPNNAESVAGIVFVDPYTERSLRRGAGRVVHEETQTIMGIERWITCMNSNAVYHLSQGEWDTMSVNESRKAYNSSKELNPPRGSDSDVLTWAAEAKGCVVDLSRLVDEKQFKKGPLNNRPICLIKSNSLPYLREISDHAVEVKYADEKKQDVAKNNWRRALLNWDSIDRECQRELLKLSRCEGNRMLTSRVEGRRVHQRDHELVAREIQRVYDDYKEQIRPKTRTQLRNFFKDVMRRWGRRRGAEQHSR